MYLAASSPTPGVGLPALEGVVGEKLEMRADDIGVHGTGHAGRRRVGVRLLRDSGWSDKSESEDDGSETHVVLTAGDV